MFERALAARAAAAVVVRLRGAAAGPALEWALPALLSFLDDSAAAVRRLGALRPDKPPSSRARRACLHAASRTGFLLQQSNTSHAELNSPHRTALHQKCTARHLSRFAPYLSLPRGTTVSRQCGSMSWSIRL